MLLQDKRNTELKETILRDIYVDNLEFAGKYVQEVDAESAPVDQRRAHLPYLRLFIFVLVMVMSPFTYEMARHKEPEASQNDKLYMTELHTESHMDLSIKNIENPIEQCKEPSVSESTEWRYQSTYCNREEHFEQQLNDFDFLLSSIDLIRLSSVFGLGVKTIVIDPGHGGRDPGAIGANGTQEKTITLDVAIKLRKRLAALNIFNVLLTREDDRTLSLADRVEYAKDNLADLFISIHVNSLPQKYINMIETYYFGPPLNYQALRLAEQENKESKFSLGELDAIIEDFGNTLKRQESARLASSIQTSLFGNMKLQDEDIRNVGIKMAPFVVLSQIVVPSVLVEISCISKVEEEAKLAVNSYREKVASYIEEGIVSYMETQQLKNLKGES